MSQDKETLFRFTIAIDKETRQYIREIAAKRGVSSAQFVRRLIYDFMECYDSDSGKLNKV